MAPDVSALAVREFLRQSAELENWTVRDLQTVLGIDANAGRQVLEILHALGYAMPDPSRRGAWINTIAGNDVAGVSRKRPIQWDTAERNLKAFLDRVHSVNSDPRFLDQVQKVVLFGPFLTTKAAVKDIDLAVETAPKERDAARHEALVRKRIEEAQASGKKLHSFIERREYAKIEVMKVLKSRSRAIALYDLEDWVLKRPHKVIFEAKR